MTPPPGRAKKAGAILLLGLVLVGWRVPAARADDGDGGPPGDTLMEVTARLEGEASALEALVSTWRERGREGVEDAARYLADSERRVWQWRVEARKAAAVGLVGSVPAGWEEGTGAFPAWGLPGIEAGPAALADEWFFYRTALARVVGVQEDVATWVAAHATGGPVPGRVCPVGAPFEFSPTWGEERPWGRTHKGEDVHAAAGTPLRAVESGTVVQAGWHWQGGFGVWLAGYYSGDVYYYAHLAWIPPEVRAGTTVEVGELVGWVGSTGNATSAHLHFGWIPDNPDQWPDLSGLADPYPLLFGLCR